MIKDEFHKYFIEAIKSKLPSNILLVSYISKKINVGREASYRRIRGDVEFSFNEVLTIVKDLKIPLFLLASKGFEYIPFRPYIMINNTIEEYRANLVKMTDDFMDIKRKGSPKVAFCYDSIPAELIFKYKNLMKMRLAKYIFQYGENGPLIFDNIEIPNSIETVSDRFNSVIENFDTALIISEQFLQATLEEIEYFASLKLFSEKFLYKLQEEINHFLDELISYTQSGINSIGKRFDIYLYHVYSTGSIILAEGYNRKIAYLKTYGPNGFSSEDPVLYEAQTNWVKQMKKNSTYITQSGELVSSDFFRKQRVLINQTIQKCVVYLS